MEQTQTQQWQEHRAGWVVLHCEHPAIELGTSTPPQAANPWRSVTQTQKLKGSTYVQIQLDGLVTNDGKGGQSVLEVSQSSQREHSCKTQGGDLLTCKDELPTSTVVSKDPVL